MEIKTDADVLSSIDWSKFDFTRWNLDGLALDGAPATVATLLQKVTSAPQWPQAIGASLPAIKTAVIEHLKIQAKSLQDRVAALDQELAARTSATQAQIAALQGKLRIASVPPAVAADPNKFQFVAKVVDQKSQLGLPGLTVQLLDPRNPGAALAVGPTDRSGNAILSLTKEQAESLASEKVDLTLAILNSSGRTLQTLQNAVCSHANQVETHVAPIPASEDTAAALETANRLSAGDSALLSSLNAKVDQLTAVFATRKQDLQDMITQVQDTISAIQGELSPAGNP